MPLLGSLSDSQLYIHCFVLIIYTNSSCCYHCKWCPILMIILLVKYYNYLSWHLVKCYIYITSNLSFCIFLYFHFCCSNVTRLLVNSSQLSQDFLVPPAFFPFFCFKVIQLLLHISCYESVLSAKCLNAFSCINSHARFFSVNRDSTREVILSLPTQFTCTHSDF